MPRSALNWDDLRFFVHAAGEGSLSGAARAMGVEHSTVGRRLAALERSLGANLLMRAPDGVRLTPVGEEVLSRVLEIERCVNGLLGATEQHRSRVRLAIPSGFASIVSESVAELRRERPDILIEVVGGANLVDMHKGEADIAIRLGPIADDTLLARRVGDVGFALYASPAYLSRRPSAPDPEDLSGHEVVGFDERLSASAPGLWLREHGSSATVMMRGREMSEVLSAAAAGVGLAVLPCVLAEHHPSLRRLSDRVVAARPLHLVLSRESRTRDAVRAAAAVVARVLRRHGSEIAGVAGR